MQWHFTRDGRAHGPVSEEDLRSQIRGGGLQPSDYVWNESFGSAWRRIAELPELAAEASSQPPAPPLAGLARISCAALVTPAWERMKAALFRPFELGKWFALGFSAWLATLGEGGGGGSFNLPDLSGWRDGKEPEVEAGPAVDFGAVADQASAFFRQYGSILFGVVAAVVLVGVVLGLVVLWLRCRGKFMFLDNLARGRSEIGEPWREYRLHANSLFRWQIVYGLVALAVFGLLLWGSFVAVAMPCVRAGTFVAAVAGPLAALLTVWVAVGLVGAYIGRFLEDFVVPIMYRLDLTATEAWGVFLGLFRAHAGALLLYGLFYAVLAVGFGMLVLLVVLATCCCAGILLFIPYLGAVVLLPMTVFFRFYSLEYLSQFGEEFRVLDR